VNFFLINVDVWVSLCALRLISRVVKFDISYDWIISNAKIDLTGHGFSSKQAGKKCSK